MKTYKLEQLDIFYLFLKTVLFIYLGIHYNLQHCNCCMQDNQYLNMHWPICLLTADCNMNIDGLPESQ
jgi:hypothetical protein